MLILVCGGRGYTNRPRLYEVLDMIIEKYGEDLEILHGAAKGADLMSEDWAKSREIPYRGVPAKWTKLKKRAGYDRNARMADLKPDRCIAFPGGDGTAMMTALCFRKDIPVYKIDWEDLTR